MSFPDFQFRIMLLEIAVDYPLTIALISRQFTPHKKKTNLLQVDNGFLEYITCITAKTQLQLDFKTIVIQALMRPLDYPFLESFLQ